MKSIIKPEIIFILIILLVVILNWYGNINNITYKQEKLKEDLTELKSKQLEKRNAFGTKGNLATHDYYKKRVLNYKYIRTAIPYVYDKDTIADTGWTNYRSEK